MICENISFFICSTFHSIGLCVTSAPVIDERILSLKPLEQRKEIWIWASITRTVELINLHSTSALDTRATVLQSPLNIDIIMTAIAERFHLSLELSVSDTRAAIKCVINKVYHLFRPSYKRDATHFPATLQSTFPRHSLKAKSFWRLEALSLLLVLFLSLSLFFRSYVCLLFSLESSFPPSSCLSMQMLLVEGAMRRVTHLKWNRERKKE